MDDASPPTSGPPYTVPEGWRAKWSDQYKAWFYVNVYTKKAQWDEPTMPAYPSDDGVPLGSPSVLSIDRSNNHPSCNATPKEASSRNLNSKATPVSPVSPMSPISTVSTIWPITPVSPITPITPTASLPTKRDEQPDVSHIMAISQVSRSVPTRARSEEKSLFPKGFKRTIFARVMARQA